MFANLESVLSGSDNDATALYDSDFWLYLALEFNPQAEIPQKLLDLKEKLNKERELRRTVELARQRLFPAVPDIPIQSYSPSYSSYSDDERRDLDELTMEYWGQVAENRQHGFTAIDIENEWIELDSYGFWDDKSWQ